MLNVNKKFINIYCNPPITINKKPHIRKEKRYISLICCCMERASESKSNFSPVYLKLSYSDIQIISLSTVIRIYYSKIAKSTIGYFLNIFLKKDSGFIKSLAIHDNQEIVYKAIQI